MKVKVILLLLICTTICFGLAPRKYTGLWEGRILTNKLRVADVYFHAELGHWICEVSLKATEKDTVELMNRYSEGVYSVINDSLIYLYCKRLLIDGIPTEINVKENFLYYFVALPTRGEFGSVNIKSTYKMYDLQRRDD